MSEPDSGIFLTSAPGSDEIDVPELEPSEHMKKLKEYHDRLADRFAIPSNVRSGDDDE